MTELFTIRGWVATEPRNNLTPKGVPITTFRLACPERRFNKDKEVWEDHYTSWFTVTAFRKLAVNTAASIKKGQRVIVHGKIRIREWENQNKKGTSAEIDADSIGHDLAWGTSYFDKGYGKRTENVAENLEDQDTIEAEVDLETGEIISTHNYENDKTLVP